MSKNLLSRSQIQQLGMAATKAFANQAELGLADLPADMAGLSKTARAEFWRHQQVAACTQRVCSFRAMIDDEYLDMKLHFEALAGLKGRATGTAVRIIEHAACHREPGCQYVRDMYQWLRQAGYSEGYMAVIMKAKFKGQTDLTRLTEWQLKQLHDTVVNRCRAKLGLGDAENRNKKQRKQWTAQSPVRSEKPRTEDCADHNLPPDKLPF